MFCLSLPCLYRIISKINWQSCRHLQCHDLGSRCKILELGKHLARKQCGSPEQSSPGTPGNREEATTTSYQMEFQKVVPLKITLDQAALWENFLYNSVIAMFTFVGCFFLEVIHIGLFKYNRKNCESYRDTPVHCFNFLNIKLTFKKSKPYKY